ncbi:MAG: PQQ-dependent sugar dehydrogenase [Candidatus Zixiibacteriota bacterium]
MIRFPTLVTGLLLGITPVLAQPRLPDGFIDEPVVGGLNTPAAMAPLPGGGILVCEQYSGTALLVEPGGRKTPLLRIDDLNPDGEERGLLSIALDPLFPARPYFYVYYTARGEVSKLSRYTLLTGENADFSVRSGSVYRVLEDIPNRAWNHNGGSIRFGPDTMLYLSIGDDARACSAQNPSDLLGAIIRLDLRSLPDTGSGPPTRSMIAARGNPLLGRGSADGAAANGGVANDSLIYAYGLRNPFRFHIDRSTGDLLIADVGQLEFEEIDYLPAPSVDGDGGQNFGWPFWEGPKKRRRRSCQPRQGEEFTAPVAHYDRSGFRASVISLALYRSNESAPYAWPDEYQGDYFFVDYYQGFVRRLKHDGGDSWRPPPPVAGQPSRDNWAESLKNVADSYVGVDGALYYLRQFNDHFEPGSGQIRRIRPALNDGP